MAKKKVSKKVSKKKKVTKKKAKRVRMLGSIEALAESIGTDEAERIIAQAKASLKRLKVKGE